MITFNQAYSNACAVINTKAWYDYCSEYNKFYVFSRYDDDSCGGYSSPCAINKEDGKAYSFVGVISGIGKMAHAYRLNKNKEWEEVPIEDDED